MCSFLCHFFPLNTRPITRNKICGGKYGHFRRKAYITNITYVLFLNKKKRKKHFGVGSKLPCFNCSKPSEVCQYIHSVYTMVKI